MPACSHASAIAAPPPRPAGSISMPGIEGTGSRRFGKETCSGEQRASRRFEISSLPRKSCSSALGAREINWGIAGKPHTKRKPGGAAAYKPPRPRGHSSSLTLPEVHLDICHCHCDRFSQDPAVSGGGEAWPRRLESEDRITLLAFSETQRHAHCSKQPFLTGTYQFLIPSF